MSGPVYGVAASPTVSPISKIGCIGDSITAGTNGNPVQVMSDYLASFGFVPTIVNRGVSGTSTQDWQPGGSYLGPAVAAFTSAGVTLVVVMLGTNDVRTPNSFTPQQHAANMAAIVSALRASGFSVVIRRQIWTVPNSGSSGSQWPADPNSIYAAYAALNATLADGYNVFVGDAAEFNYFATRPDTLADGVHPTGDGNFVLGRLWAAGLMGRYGSGILPRLPVVAAGARKLPTLASASPTIWLDASNAKTLFSDAGSTMQTTDGGPVAAFADALGSGRKVLQSTAASQPALKLNRVNNRQMLRFDGSSDSMASASGQTWASVMRSGQSFTARLVFTTTANRQNQGVVSTTLASVSTYKPGANFYVDGDSGNLKPHLFSTGGSGGNSLLAPLSNSNSINHAVLTTDGASLRCRVSVGAADITASSDASGDALDQLVIGIMPGLNWMFSGDFGEFALWPGVATSAEVDALLSDAAAWWGS